MRYTRTEREGEERREDNEKDAERKTERKEGQVERGTGGGIVGRGSEKEEARGGSRGVIGKHNLRTSVLSYSHGL